MRYFLSKSNKTLFTLFLFISFCIYSNAQVQQDLYGRPIKSSTGEKINYSQSDLNLVSNSLKTATSQVITATTYASKCSKDTIKANCNNLYSIMGNCIGRNSMHTMDIDKDGVTELVCTATTQTFGSANYWYIMHYNSQDNTCSQIWTSPQYENSISTLEIIDYNNDGKYEILLGFINGTLQIYDAASRDLLKEFKPVTEQINSIVYADADNDGQKDIVISCVSNTYILDSKTLTQKFKINKGANYVRVGNIDNDAQNEIVLSSGTAYQLVGSTLTTEWIFNTSGDGYLELYDTDNDSKNEIILAQSWYYIYVYDADTQTTKYSIKTNLDINALLVQDVNNDGVAEILYGDGQWGQVYCYNAVTQTKLWSVNNPEHGVAAINYADIDKDGKSELIWSAGWTSTGSDYLYIYNIADNKLKWRSDDIVGPFYAIAKGDVDGDGKQEIVAVSYESESGYESGILMIIDAQTNLLKWKSNGNFLLNVWTGLYNVVVKDIDNDSNNEIIIAAGQTYTGEIWIIDGKSHTIKSSHIFYAENISEFYSLTVEDIDNDGMQELITVTNSGLYVINPSNWYIKWRVNITSSSAKPIVKCADINGDGKKEIIVCHGTIQIINSSDHSIWTSAASNYVNTDIFDVTNDNIPDIIATTSTGHITVLDGISKSTLNDFNPETTEISSVRLMKYNNLPVYIYSCMGRLNFYVNDTSCLVTQYLGSKIGEIESLKLLDLNNSGSSDILLGTPTSVLKISGDIVSCTGFNIKVTNTIVSCGKNDGKLELTVTGGTTPYSYQWNDNSTSSSLLNLSPGNYWVKVQDNGMCYKKRTMNLLQAYISADVQVANEGCIDKGSITVNLNHVNAPYTTSWSNLKNQLINSNLTHGSYTVTITDSKNCTFQKTAVVNKDTIIVNPVVTNVSCFGSNNGTIRLNIISGSSPFVFNWDSFNNTNYVQYLKAGKYNVTIKDNLGCERNLSFNISEPDKITYTKLVTPDDLKTDNWDGKVMINDIQGGTPPYQVYWPRFSKYSDYVEILPSGKYAFIVSDVNNCEIKDTAIISSFSTGINDSKTEPFQVFPNPAINELFINGENNLSSDLKIELIDQNGQVVRNYQLSGDKVKRIGLEGLAPGMYILKFRTNKSLYTRKVIIK